MANPGTPRRAHVQSVFSSITLPLLKGTVTRHSASARALSHLAAEIDDLLAQLTRQGQHLYDEYELVKKTFAYEKGRLMRRREDARTYAQQVDMLQLLHDENPDESAIEEQLRGALQRFSEAEQAADEQRAYCQSIVDKLDARERDVVTHIRAAELARLTSQKRALRYLLDLDAGEEAAAAAGGAHGTTVPRRGSSPVGGEPPATPRRGGSAQQQSALDRIVRAVDALDAESSIETMLNMAKRLCRPLNRDVSQRDVYDSLRTVSTTASKRTAGSYDDSADASRSDDEASSDDDNDDDDDDDDDDDATEVNRRILRRMDSMRGAPGEATSPHLPRRRRVMSLGGARVVSTRTCACPLTRAAAQIADELVPSSVSPSVSTTWNDLPELLQLLVISHVPIADLASLGAVSRHCRHLLEDELLWQRITTRIVEVEEERHLQDDDSTPINRWVADDDGDGGEHDDARMERWRVFLQARKQASGGVRGGGGDAAAGDDEQSLFELVRGGVPAPLREQFWCADSSMLERCNSNLYFMLCQEPLPARQLAEIERDIHRTLPELPVFMQEKGRSALTRVLRALSLYDAQVSYVQGMNFLAAVVLLYTSEHAAFWLMAHLMERFSLRELWLPSFPGLVRHLFTFDKLLHGRLPALHAHLQREGVEIASFSTGWFMTLFAGTLNYNVAARVLDVFLVRGWTFAYAVALALLERSQVALLDADFEGILLHIMCMRQLNARGDDLIERACSIRVRQRRVDALWGEFALLNVESVEGIRQRAGAAKRAVVSARATLQSITGRRKKRSASRKGSVKNVR